MAALTDNFRGERAIHYSGKLSDGYLWPVSGVDLFFELWILGCFGAWNPSGHTGSLSVWCVEKLLTFVILHEKYNLPPSQSDKLPFELLNGG